MRRVVRVWGEGEVTQDVFAGETKILDSCRASTSHVGKSVSGPKQTKRRRENGYQRLVGHRFEQNKKLTVEDKEEVENCAVKQMNIFKMAAQNQSEQFLKYF